MIALLTVSCAVCTHARSLSEQLVCDDNVCAVEANGGKELTGEIFSVVCPMGQSVVKPIEQAPRLSSLDGKTIAVVGGSFMASVTHPELKRLILKEYPTATVYVLSKIGSAGVFPGPGIRRNSVEQFQSRLKELKVDAVISGNGGCGLCTPKEAGSSIAAEYIGIPSVTIAGPGFVGQVAVTAANNGVSVARVACYPGAFAAHTEAELLDNTRNVLWPQIKESLTKPITDSEKVYADKLTPPDPRATVFSGSFDDVNRHFAEMNWSDGLPVVPPTMERIGEFLRFGGMSYDTPVATLPIAHRKTLAIHVAACGVMAGCRPEYMPILVALTKALGAPDFRRTLSSTHAWNPYCYVKQDRMGTFGYLMPWCLAEDEEACARLGWSPYHIGQGYAMNDNTVTVASALVWGNNMAPSTDDAGRIAQLVAWDITERCQFALGSGKQYTYRTILMTEPVAGNLKNMPTSLISSRS